jgi:hypothetical protein
MFAGSLLIGFTIILVALWLEYQDVVNTTHIINEGPPGRQDFAEALRVIDDRFVRVRRRWRLVIHLLLGACGGLMIAAGWVGPGAFWIAAWTSVALLMLCILFLAAADALRTHCHQARKLNQARFTASGRANRTADSDVV